MVSRTSYLGLVFVLALLFKIGFTPAALVAAPKAPHPNIDGSWNFATLTPLERPKGLTTATFASPEEKAEFLKKDAAQRKNDYFDRFKEGDVPPYGLEWYEWGTDTNGDRTSLITDPPDGRLPPQVPEARERMTARFKAMREATNRGPEDRSLQERCILGANAGPPYIPSFYNNNLEIGANDTYAMLITEMIHTPRVVPLQPTGSNSLQQYGGVAHGRWEGDSLVVETTRFRGDAAAHVLRGASDQLKLTERFSLKDANTLRYEFTVDDPATWTKQWTAVVYMARSKEPMYEYACHEGNYAMSGILAGARTDEFKAAAKKAAGPSR
jgi:hypothetical protein